MCRRKRTNSGANSQHTTAENNTTGRSVEMQEHPSTAVVQSETSAPAGNTAAGDKSTSATQLSSSLPRSSSFHDITLIDNDLYT